MPLFQIVPTHPQGEAIEIEAGNATAALYLVSARGLTGADVWSDGRYIFSARMQGSPSCFFAIHHREELTSASLAPGLSTAGVSDEKEGIHSVANAVSDGSHKGG